MSTDNLRKRLLGRAGVEVTQLGYGAAERGTSDGSEADDQVGEVLNAALDAGINFIDTAPDYGASEGRIGRFISHRRNEFFLATKCGCNIDIDGTKLEPGHLWTADRLHRNIDQSLQRLKAGYVDLLQMHNPTVEDVESGRLVEALEEVRKAGKTRFIGVSSTAPHLASFADSGAFDTFQVPYSAVERRHEAMIGYAADLGAGLIIRGGIGLGHRASEELQQKWRSSGLEELRGDMTRHEFVLRFTLSHPSCHTTIVGTTNIDHLEENIAAAKAGPLPAEMYDEAKRRLASIGEVAE